MCVHFLFERAIEVITPQDSYRFTMRNESNWLGSRKKIIIRGATALLVAVANLP